MVSLCSPVSQTATASHEDDIIKNVDGRDKPGHDEKFAGVEE